MNTLPMKNHQIFRSEDAHPSLAPSMLSLLKLLSDKKDGPSKDQLMLRIDTMLQDGRKPNEEIISDLINLYIKKSEQHYDDANGSELSSRNMRKAIKVAITYGTPADWINIWVSKISVYIRQAQGKSMLMNDSKKEVKETLESIQKCGIFRDIDNFSIIQILRVFAYFSIASVMSDQRSMIDMLEIAFNDVQQLLSSKFNIAILDLFKIEKPPSELSRKRRLLPLFLLLTSQTTSEAEKDDIFVCIIIAYIVHLEVSFQMEDVEKYKERLGEILFISSSCLNRKSIEIKYIIESLKISFSNYLNRLYGIKNQSEEQLNEDPQGKQPKKTDINKPSNFILGSTFQTTISDDLESKYKDYNLRRNNKLKLESLIQNPKESSMPGSPEDPKRLKRTLSTAHNQVGTFFSNLKESIDPKNEFSSKAKLFVQSRNVIGTKEIQLKIKPAELNSMLKAKTKVKSLERRMRFFSHRSKQKSLLEGHKLSMRQNPINSSFLMNLGTSKTENINQMRTISYTERSRSLNRFNSLKKAIIKRRARSSENARIISNTAKPQNVDIAELSSIGIIVTKPELSKETVSRSDSVASQRHSTSQRSSSRKESETMRVRRILRHENNSRIRRSIYQNSNEPIAKSHSVVALDSTNLQVKTFQRAARRSIYAKKAAVNIKEKSRNKNRIENKLSRSGGKVRRSLFLERESNLQHSKGMVDSSQTLKISNFVPHNMNLGKNKKAVLDISRSVILDKNEEISENEVSIKNENTPEFGKLELLSSFSEDNSKEQHPGAIKLYAILQLLRTFRSREAFSMIRKWISSTRHAGVGNIEVLSNRSIKAGMRLPELSRYHSQIKGLDVSRFPASFKNKLSIECRPIHFKLDSMEDRFHTFTVSISLLENMLDRSFFFYVLHYRSRELNIAINIRVPCNFALVDFDDSLEPWNSLRICLELYLTKINDPFIERIKNFDNMFYLDIEDYRYRSKVKTKKISNCITLIREVFQRKTIFMYTENGGKFKRLTPLLLELLRYGKFIRHKYLHRENNIPLSKKKVFFNLPNILARKIEPDSLQMMGDANDVDLKERNKYLVIRSHLMTFPIFHQSRYYLCSLNIDNTDDEFSIRLKITERGDRKKLYISTSLEGVDALLEITKKEGLRFIAKRMSLGSGFNSNFSRIVTVLRRKARQEIARFTKCNVNPLRKGNSHLHESKLADQLKLMANSMNSDMVFSSFSSGTNSRRDSMKSISKSETRLNQTKDFINQKLEVGSKFYFRIKDKGHYLFYTILVDHEAIIKVHDQFGEKSCFLCLRDSITISRLTTILNEQDRSLQITMFRLFLSKNRNRFKGFSFAHNDEHRGQPYLKINSDSSSIDWFNGVFFNRGRNTNPKEVNLEVLYFMAKVPSYGFTFTKAMIYSSNTPNDNRQVEEQETKNRYYIELHFFKKGKKELIQRVMLSETDFNNISTLKTSLLALSKSKKINFLTLLCGRLSEFKTPTYKRLGITGEKSVRYLEKITNVKPTDSTDLRLMKPLPLGMKLIAKFILTISNQYCIAWVYKSRFLEHTILRLYFPKTRRIFMTWIHDGELDGDNKFITSILDQKIGNIEESKIFHRQENIKKLKIGSRKGISSLPISWRKSLFRSQLNPESIIKPRTRSKARKVTVFNAKPSDKPRTDFSGLDYSSFSEVAFSFLSKEKVSFSELFNLLLLNTESTKKKQKHINKFFKILYWETILEGLVIQRRKLGNVVAVVGGSSCTIKPDLYWKEHVFNSNIFLVNIFTRNDQTLDWCGDFEKIYKEKRDDVHLFIRITNPDNVLLQCEKIGLSKILQMTGMDNLNILNQSTIRDISISLSKIAISKITTSTFPIRKLPSLNPETHITSVPNLAAPSSSRAPAFLSGQEYILLSRSPFTRWPLSLLDLYYVPCVGSFACFTAVVYTLSSLSFARLDISSALIKRLCPNSLYLINNGLFRQAGQAIEKACKNSLLVQFSRTQQPLYTTHHTKSGIAGPDFRHRKSSGDRMKEKGCTEVIG